MQDSHTVQTFAWTPTEFSSQFPLLLGKDSDYARILFLGELVGRPGRSLLKVTIGTIKKATSPDFITINSDCGAPGFGINNQLFKELKEFGVDAVTMGEHWNSKMEVHQIRKSEPTLVLPMNLKEISGVLMPHEFYIPRIKKKLLMISLLGSQQNSHEVYSPFEILLNNFGMLASQVTEHSHIVTADVNAQSSAEKQAIFSMMDGVFAGAVGSSSHVPTADERITPRGTSYITDLGMLGAYDTIVGMNIEKALKTFLHDPKNPSLHQESSGNSRWLNGFLVEVCLKSCLAQASYRIQYRESEEIWLVTRVERPV